MTRTTMANFTLNRGRQGTSLLEVMFALGVATIGLLGVSSLIVVAGVRLGQAEKIDRASALARESIEAFRVRNFHHDSYRWANGTPFPTLAISPHLLHRWHMPICIDPLGVAGPMTVNGTQQLVSSFPAVGDPAYAIPRVTHSSLMANGTVQAQQLLAESIFVSRSDLIFDRPKDRTIPAQLLRSVQGIPEYEGRYSWFATMSPSSLTSMRYILSIVVVRGRSLDATAENDAGFPVRFFGGNNTLIGGAIIRGAGGIKIPDNSWIMLRHRTAPVADWYRVVHSDGPLTAANVAAADFLIPGDEGGIIVELRGDDWPIPTDPNEISTQATIMKDVAYVLEKSILVKQ